MVKVLNSKIVTYDKQIRVAQLCIHTKWSTDGNRINTPFGVYSGLIASDPKDVAAYKKQGIKFKEDKKYFVRIMDVTGKCVKVLRAYKNMPSAKSHFKKLKHNGKKR